MEVEGPEFIHRILFFPLALEEAASAADVDGRLWWWEKKIERELPLEWRRRRIEAIAACHRRRGSSPRLAIQPVSYPESGVKEGGLPPTRIKRKG